MAWLCSNEQSIHLVHFSNSIVTQLIVTMEKSENYFSIFRLVALVIDGDCPLLTASNCYCGADDDDFPRGG